MDCDVVIVGAGPAGSSAARLLAEAGAEVVLIDAARFPRRKPCGGWVNDRAVRDFPFVDQARRAVKALPFKRLVFHSPDLALEAEFSGRKHAGYVVARDVFDAALVKAAQKAGAKALLGRKVVTVDAHESEAVVVLSGGKRVAGRILVGADGVHSAVARSVGLRPQWREEHLVLTRSRDVPLTPRQRSACFGSSPALHVALAFGGASGYAWAFPGPRHVNVGIGVRGKDAARLDALYRAWADGVRAKGLVPDGANLDRPDGAAVPAGAAVDFENHVGKRTVLVGDAGGFASAASGEGIYPGIRSAAIAAQCILKALEADRGRIPGSTCQDQLMTFHTMWRQQMAPHLQMPNVNVTFLLPLIYTNQEIADRFGRAFLFGENL